MTDSFVDTGHENLKTRSGKLAKGCELCVRGEKLVLFVTGVCGNGCSYCPVSDKKNMHDVIFANEAKVVDDVDLLIEAELMDATGAGVTGGDPLATLGRTEKFIKLLKSKYGKSFHIHLYTPLLRVNEKTLARLHAAGLDEIRFHPKVDDRSEWHKLKLARAFDWSVGVEIPALPDFEPQTKQLLEYLKKHDLVDFVNLNEFEYADNAVFESAGKHYEPKDSLSYAVKQSAPMAKRLLMFAESIGLPTHFCTAKSKDAVQLAMRMLRRSKKAAMPFDAADDEGLLTRGAIYDVLDLTDTDVTQRLESLGDVDRAKSLSRLQKLRDFIVVEWEVPDELIVIDAPRLRLLTTTSVAEFAAKELNTTVALVKEYPTADCFLVEAEVLRKKVVADADND